MSDGIRRRDFLKVVGVSGAGAGVAGCSTEQVEKLLPFVVPPEDITPGVATWYATSCDECPAGCGMWVRTREGRAVKVEGNSRDPVSAGALCARGHSSLQGLYDPDRYPGPRVREGAILQEISWEDAEALLAQRIQDAAGNVLLINGRVGPSLDALMDSFISSLGGTRLEHEGLSEAPLREAARIAFGRDLVPRYDFEAARFVVSFGADFLETWLSPVAFGRGFARASGAGDGEKARFVFVGPRLGLTGQNADEWVPVRPGSEAAVALAMARVLADNGADAGPVRADPAGGRSDRRGGGRGHRGRRHRGAGRALRGGRPRPRRGARRSGTAPQRDRCESRCAPAEQRGRQHRPDRVPGRWRRGGGSPLLRHGGGHSLDGWGGRGSRARTRLQPGLHAAAGVGIRRGARRGPVQGELRIEYGRDVPDGRPRPSRPSLPRVLGRRKLQGRPRRTPPARHAAGTALRHQAGRGRTSVVGQPHR